MVVSLRRNVQRCAITYFMSHEATHRTILVVDDDVGVLRFLRDTLGAFAACSVETSPSSEYAFELALRQSFDLFIFDFAMPVVDGATLYQFIRKTYQYDGRSPARRLPPLLLLSGNAAQPRAHELLKEPGVIGLLPKPFTVERLLAKLESCLPGVTRQTSGSAYNP